jgi:hypothetical protein
MRSELMGTLAPSLTLFLSDFDIRGLFMRASMIPNVLNFVQQDILRNSDTRQYSLAGTSCILDSDILSVIDSIQQPGLNARWSLHIRECSLQGVHKLWTYPHILKVPGLLRLICNLDWFPARTALRYQASKFGARMSKREGATERSRKK